MLIDCDANATYAPDEELRGVIAGCLELVGNPSSLHRAGQRARAAIEQARVELREFLSVSAQHSVVFTSGASEANNLVVASAAALTSGALVSSAIEHPCVLEPLSRLKAGGREVMLAKPNEEGEVSVQSIAELVKPGCSLVSVMLANNETGAINDVRSIAAAARKIEPKVLIHADAAQVAGKLALSFDDLGVDFLTISGHKFGAPAGVGALVARHGAPLQPLILGGPQEGKLRGGTENVFAISAMGRVAARVRAELPARIKRMREARDQFEALVLEASPGAQVNAAKASRLPNTCSLFIPGVRAADLVVAMDLEGILVSTGAACSSGKPEPSHVLQAMGQAEERVRATVRLSFRADAKSDDAGLVAAALGRAVERARK